MIRVFIITFLIFLMPYYGAEANPNPNDNTLLRVKNNNVMRCAYHDVPPYLYKNTDTGAFQGIVHDIMQELIQIVDVKLEYIEAQSFRAVETGLNEKSLDIYCGIFLRSEAAEERYLLSDPIFKIPYYAYVRKEDNRFQSIEDINRPSVTVAVLENHISEELAHKLFPQAKKHIYTAQHNMDVQPFDDLSEDRFDVLIYDAVRLYGYLKNHPDHIKNAFKDPLEMREAVFAFGVGQIDFKNVIDVSIFALITNDTIDRILFSHDFNREMIFRYGLDDVNSSIVQSGMGCDTSGGLGASPEDFAAQITQTYSSDVRKNDPNNKDAIACQLPDGLPDFLDKKK